MSPDSSYFLPMKSTTRQENAKDANQKTDASETPVHRFATKATFDCSQLSVIYQSKLQPIIAQIQRFDKEYESLKAHIEAEREDLAQRRDFETKKATRDVLSKFNELNSILNVNLASVEARRKLLEALTVDINTKKCT